MNKGYIVAAAGAIVLLLLPFSYGRAQVALVYLLGALTVAPFSLFTIGKTPLVSTVGIATVTPRVTTYSLLLWSCAFVLLIEGKWRREALLAVPIALYVVLGLGAFWPQTPVTISGVVHIITVAFAWIIGVHLGRSLTPNGETAKLCAKSLCALTIVLGVSVAFQEITGSASGGRASGLFSHPAMIGKIAVVLMGLLLECRQVFWPHCLHEFWPRMKHRRIGFGRGRVRRLLSEPTRC